MLDRLLRRLPVADEDGQGLAEYALILALIAVVAIVSLIVLGTQISDIIGGVAENIGRPNLPLAATRGTPRGCRAQRFPPDHAAMIKWLFRLFLLRVLGKRAVPLLAVLGLLGALRSARTRDVEAVDPETGRVKLKGERGWR